MAALCRKCLSFFKKEVVLCVAALLAAASCFLSPPQRRLPHLYRLEHPGPALRPYGGDAGPAEGKLLRLPGKPAAGAHPLHPHPGVPAGVFALCVQHGHHQRRVPHRLCALRHHHPPHGRAGAAAGAPGGAADHRRQPGQHAHPHGQPPKPVPLQPVRPGVRPLLRAAAPLCAGIGPAAGGVHPAAEARAHRPGGPVRRAGKPPGPALLRRGVRPVPAGGVQGAARPGDRPHRRPVPPVLRQAGAGRHRLLPAGHLCGLLPLCGEHLPAYRGAELPGLHPGGPGGAGVHPHQPGHQQRARGTATSTTSPAWGSAPSAGCCSPMCWHRPCCWRCPSCC